MELERKVQVIVRDGDFRDALYFAEGAVPSDVEVSALAQARVDAWNARVKAPPREPTQEEKDAQLEFAVAERDRLEREISEASPERVAAAREKLGLAEKQAEVVEVRGR